MFFSIKKKDISIRWAVGHWYSVTWGRRTRQSYWSQYSWGRSLTVESDRGAAGGTAWEGVGGRQHEVPGKRGIEEGMSPSSLCTGHTNKICYRNTKYKHATKCGNKKNWLHTKSEQVIYNSQNRMEQYCINKIVCIPMCRGTFLWVYGLQRSTCRSVLAWGRLTVLD